MPTTSAPTPRPTFHPCGWDLVPVEASECPSDADLLNCDTQEVACGELCEADGECGTTDIDNCHIRGYDVYRKVCESSAPTTLAPSPTPSLVPSPAPSTYTPTKLPTPVPSLVPTSSPSSFPTWAPTRPGVTLASALVLDGISKEDWNAAYEEAFKESLVNVSTLIESTNDFSSLEVSDGPRRSRLRRRLETASVSVSFVVHVDATSNNGTVDVDAYVASFEDELLNATTADEASGESPLDTAIKAHGVDSVTTNEEASLDVITEKTVGVVASRPPTAAPTTQTWQPTPAPTPRPSPRPTPRPTTEFALQEGHCYANVEASILYTEDYVGWFSMTPQQCYEGCLDDPETTAVELRRDSSTDQGYSCWCKIAADDENVKCKRPTPDMSVPIGSMDYYLVRSGPYTCYTETIDAGNLERDCSEGEGGGNKPRKGGGVLIAIVVCVVGCCCCAAAAAVAVAKGACGLKKKPSAQTPSAATPVSAAKPQDLHGQMARWYQAPQQAALHYRFGPFPQPERLEEWAGFVQVTNAYMDARARTAPTEALPAPPPSAPPKLSPIKAKAAGMMIAEPPLPPSAPVAEPSPSPAPEGWGAGLRRLFSPRGAVLTVDASEPEA